MAISAAQVKALRDKSGLGMMDCKKLLSETDGDMEKAFDLSRKRGMDVARKKGDRATGDGRIGHYIHHDGKTGVLLELNCETDFVAKTDQFQGLMRELCMHIAAAKPVAVSRDQIPAERIEKEKEIYAEQAKGKPDHVVEKIVQGKLNSFFAENVLLDQKWVKDNKKSIQELITETIAAVGENIAVARFACFVVGQTAG